MPDSDSRRPPGATDADLAWIRGATMPRLSRRDLLRATGLGAGGLAAGAVLSACGVSGGKAKATSSSFWTGKTSTGHLVFGNWPLYIDVAHHTHPSLELFTKRTGIKVAYKEDINENASFYGKIEPSLAAGQGTGYDIIVITNGIYLAKLLQGNYLIPLDHSKLPNFAKNASPTVKNPSYDPGNKYTVAWQSGMTGIGYNPKYIKRPITSFNDLLDPAFKGKIGMFGDNQDLPNLALLGVGVKPETSTPADWQKAADKLKSQRPLVRKYYEQDYIGPLSKGDTWISMAWSGDVYQANASTPGLGLKFVVPDEGALLWTDNMCIPVHAKDPVDALEMMNFVYDPKIAAMIAEWVNYITPVPAASQVISADAAKASGSDRAALESLANSPLIFPNAEMASKLHRYRVLTSAEEKQWDSIFEPIYQG